MATEAQNKYIADLVVVKTKEFKEVKELLVSSGIVSEDAETVKTAQSIAEINAALDDGQASKFIDELIAAKEPSRDRAYSKRRVEAAVASLDSIKGTISNWGFK